MSRLGTETQLVEWTRVFLLDRVSVLEVGTATHEVHPFCGVPQGSPASPILFLIYMNDSLHNFGSIQRINRQALTDDLSYGLLACFEMVWRSLT